MKSSCMIVDDFFDNPAAARRTALGLDFPPAPKGVYYQGRNSRQSMAWPNHEAMFSNILGQQLVALGQSHGCVRVTLADDPRPSGRVHCDPGAAWAGIIGLSRDEDWQGGTDFFIHKRTGSDRAPINDEEAQRLYGKPTPRDALIDVLDPAKGENMEEWEHSFTLPLKFNRCILFRPWFWHSSGDGFGDSVENGRLVLLLFFKPGPNALNTDIVPPI
ncbi:MAG: hypothetical protein GDA49_00145 [Rhodospirillales bacterium]|nr:hypothetical protein [Rhodospirillales bacterium]